MSSCFSSVTIKKFGNFLLILAGLSLSHSDLLYGNSKNPAQTINPTLSITKEEARPWRTGIIKFSPELDRIKPPGLADFAGITEASGKLLIGPYNEEWIGAFRYPEMKAEWWMPTKSTLTVPPAVFGNWGVLGFRNGDLIKFNVRSGKTEWTASLDTFPAREIRKISDHKLIVVTASQSVYAIDYESGATLWICDQGAPEGVAIRTMSPPLLHREVLYLGLASGEVSAINSRTGEKLWVHNPVYSAQRFKDVVGEMTIIGNTLIVSRYDGLVTGINTEKPSVPANGWSKPMLFSSSVTTSTFRHGRMYVGTQNGYVHAINPQNAKEIWTAQPGSSVTMVIAGDSEVYTTGSDGQISALDGKSGRTIWHDHVGGSVVARPVYIQKDIYFPSSLRVLYGYRVLTTAPAVPEIL